MNSKLKQKMQRGERTFGMHVSIGDICVGKVVGGLGYDFIFLDMEHTCLSYEQLQNQMNTIQAKGTDVLVRVPEHDLPAMKKIMEMGPDGVILPMVHSYEECRELIRYTLYPPYGNRGFGPLNAVDFGAKDALEYARHNHEEMVRIVMIEHKDFIDDLERIMTIPFIDGFLFGASDLSGSINELGDVFGEHTSDLIRRAIRVLHDKKRYVGISTGSTDPKVLQYWNELGMDMLSAGQDYGFILEKARQQLETLRHLPRA